MSAVVEITSLAFGGKGIGRIDGKVVFVPYTAPGDVARIKITSEKKGFSEGELIEIIKPSPERVVPGCRLHEICGGCSLQHMSYSTQVEWKQKIFEETLKRIGKVEGLIFDPPKPSVKEYNYRGRARFQVEGEKWGFFAAKSHSVIDIEDCPVLDESINETFREIKKAFSKIRHGIYALEIGVSEKDGKTVAAFYISKDTGFSWREALKDIKGLKGVEVWRSPLKKDKGRRIFADGDRNLFYEVSGIEFSAGISVFSQVNRFQNRDLVEKVIEYAGLTGTEKTLDLFSGVGNLTLPLARASKEALGVEASPEAVIFAGENARNNGVTNVRFEAEDALGWLKTNIKTLEKTGFDMVVLDPPRGGEPDVAKTLSALRPKGIVYVSCSPPTLARDVSFLTGSGYRVSRAGLIDMFPQTFHIEGIVRLEKAG